MSFFFINELKSQTAFSKKLEYFLETHQLSKSQIDSLNKRVDTSLYTQGSSEMMLIQLFHIEQIAMDMHYATGDADAKFNIARHYVIKFKLPYAIKYFFKSLDLDELNKDTVRMAKVNLQIGVVYFQQKNYISALKYFRTSSELYKHTILRLKQSQCNYLLGVVYRDLKKYDSAEIYFIKGINLKFELRNKNGFEDSSGIKESFMEIANMFITQRLPDSALAYLNKSTLFSSHLDYDYSFLTRKYNIEGHIYLLKNKPELALQSAKLAVKDALLNNGEPTALSEAYKIYFLSAYAMNNYKEAYEFQNKYLYLRDSLFSAENSASLAKEESYHDIGKKQNEISLLEEKNKLHSRLMYSLTGGIISLIIISLLLFNRNRIRKRANIAITEQKEIVEKKNREITQSINYAKRIQTAILPPQKMVKEFLPDSFIFYQPKDIVAGDFYWMEQVQLADELISQSANQLILFAACDCTGHGVPGAMVSVVCHNALNRAVREFGLVQPAAILDKTAELVIENFAKSEEEIKDGMDISLCYFDAKTNTLQWAGANNPLWVVKQNDKQQIVETIADKQPIGQDQYNHPFTNHTFTIDKGDTIYLFTDGFSDQFGGPTGQKKLTRRRFKELIISLQHLSMEAQGKELEKFITDYRNREEQIDDILVMGIRV